MYHYVQGMPGQMGDRQRALKMCTLFDVAPGWGWLLQRLRRHTFIRSFFSYKMSTHLKVISIQINT